MLHQGNPVKVRLEPAGAHAGIRFVRTDLEDHPEIIASLETLDGQAAQRRTSLAGASGVRVEMIEHMMAACLGLGLDNVRILIDGPELPIMDGSVQPYVELIDRAGLKTLDAPRQCYQLNQPVVFANDYAEIIALPAKRMHLTFFAMLREHGMENQAAEIDLVPEAFRSIAPARTFVFYEDVEKLRSAGLIKGGSLDCALVLRDGELLEGQGDYRLPNELACHKLLDLIGDLAILGRPIAAHISARGSGHALHQAFARQLVKELT